MEGHQAAEGGRIVSGKEPGGQFQKAKKIAVRAWRGGAGETGSFIIPVLL
jgi:hypothetical protein